MVSNSDGEYYSRIHGVHLSDEIKGSVHHVLLRPLALAKLELALS